MRKYLYMILTLVTFMFVTNMAMAEDTPFSFEANKRFNKLEQKKVMKFYYDYSVLPSSDVEVTKNIFGANAVLPAGADITSVYYYIKQAFTATAATQLKNSIACGNANLLTGVDFLVKSKDNGYQSADYTAGTFGSALAGLVGSSDCQIKVTQTLGAATAGQFYGWVEYVIPTPTNSKQYQY